MINLRSLGFNIILFLYLIPIKIKTKKYNFFIKPIIILSWFKNIFILLKNKNKNIKIKFETQGPVFIKFGQWLSNRKDILNPEQQKLLSSLQDKVPEHSFNFTIKTLKKEFGKNFHKLIKFVNHKPIGSGSLSQVYHVKYKKKDAVIKILHPNLHLKIMSDLNFIYFVKKYANKNKFIKIINQTLDIDLFCKSIIEQINLETEANNLNRLKNDFIKIPKVSIPELYYSSSNIIIESYQIGLKYEDFIKKYPTKEKEAHTLISWVIRKMTMHTNFIHADLHHGNMLFKISNNQVYLSLIDFGLVSELDEKSQIHLKKFLKYLFFIDRSAEADLLESFNKNKSASQKIKKIILSFIGKNENEPIFYIKKNNLTLKNIIDVPDSVILKYIPTQKFKSDINEIEIINKLHQVGVCFDFFKLSTFLMIDSIECLILPDKIEEAITYNLYKLKYGKDNNFYNFELDKFI